MKFLVVPCVLASCLGIGWAVFLDSQERSRVEDGTASPEALAVEAVELETREVVESLELVGSLEASRDVDIRSRVSGLVEKLTVDVGDAIQEGQELVQIEASQERELVRQAQAAIEVARAEKAAQDLRAEAARRERDRQADLRKKGVGTAQQLEDAESKLAIALAESRLSASKVARAESELESSRLSVQERRIIAPMAGRIASREVEEGDLAKSDLVLMRIVDLSTVRIAVHVGETDYRRLREGLVTELRVDTYPGQVFSGRVDRLAPVLNPDTRTAVVYVATDNPRGLLKPGMHARVRVVLDRHDQAVVVPLSAVVDGPEGSVVFVVTGDGKHVRRVPVTLGLVDDGFVEVLDGINSSSRVVTLGSHLVQDGAHVEVVDAQAPSAN